MGDIIVTRNRVGYTLQAAAANQSLTASTTYYFGSNYGNTMQSTAASARIYIPKSGVIRAVYLHFNNTATVSSGESSTVSVRLNNTTDTTVSSAVLNNAVVTAFNKTDLNIAVSAGDYIEIKLATPAWVTAPTGVRPSAIIYVE